MLTALEAVDHDLSRAVVRVAQPALAKAPQPPVELLSFGRRAVIVVTPTRTLEKRTGVFLVPLSDGRALIAFDESMTPSRLELTIQDELDGGELTPEDAALFVAIRDLLKDARRSRSVSVQQRSIIVIEFPAIRPKRGRRLAQRNGGVE